MSFFCSSVWTSCTCVAIIFSLLLIFTRSTSSILPSLLLMTKVLLSELREGPATHPHIRLHVARTLQFRLVLCKLASWVRHEIERYSNRIYLMNDIRHVIVVQNHTMELFSSRFNIIVQFILLFIVYK